MKAQPQLLSDQDVPAEMQSCTMQTFTAPVTGNYLITVAGAQGGGSTGNPTFAQPGGLGAVVEGAVTLQAGASIPIIVGSTGGDGYASRWSLIFSIHNILKSLPFLVVMRYD